MKTKAKTQFINSPARLLRWTIFAAAICSMLVLLAVMTGMRDGRFAKAPPATCEHGQYHAGTVDMAAIFRAF